MLVPVHGLQRLAGIAADKSDEVIRVFNSVGPGQHGWASEDKYLHYVFRR